MIQITKQFDPGPRGTDYSNGHQDQNDETILNAPDDESIVESDEDSDDPEIVEGTDEEDELDELDNLDEPDESEESEEEADSIG